MKLRKCELELDYFQLNNVERLSKSLGLNKKRIVFFEVLLCCFMILPATRLPQQTQQDIDCLAPHFHTFFHAKFFPNR